MDISKGATKQEIAAYYNVSLHTLNKWLAPIANDLQDHHNHSRTYTPAQMEIILKHIGRHD